MPAADVVPMAVGWQGPEPMEGDMMAPPCAKASGSSNDAPAVGSAGSLLSSRGSAEESPVERRPRGAPAAGAFDAVAAGGVVVQPALVSSSSAFGVPSTSLAGAAGAAGAAATAAAAAAAASGPSASASRVAASGAAEAATHRSDAPSAAARTTTDRSKRPRLALPPPPPPLTELELAFPQRSAGPNRPDTAEGHLETEPGDNLAARFKVMAKLGEGTFGRVLECWDRGRGKYVAIKAVRAVPKYRDAAMGEIRVLSALTAAGAAAVVAAGLSDGPGLEGALRAVDAPRPSSAAAEGAAADGGAAAAAAPASNASPGELAELPVAAWAAWAAQAAPALAASARAARAADPDSPAGRPSSLSPAAQAAAGRKCVRLLEWFDARGHVCMTFPRLGPSLYDVLRRNGYRPLPVPLVRKLVAQVAAATAFVHRAGFVHTDLKPENLLLARDGARQVQWPAGSRLAWHLPACNDVLLADFGSAAHAADRRAATISTRHYRAPEVVLGLGWSHPADMWSLGCILVELLTGEVLFNTHQDLEHVAMMEAILGPVPVRMAQRAARGPARELFAPSGALAWPGRASSRRSLAAVAAVKPLPQLLAKGTDASAATELPEALDLLAKLLAIDPARRATAEEVLSHPFLASAARDEGLL